MTQPTELVEEDKIGYYQHDIYYIKEPGTQLLADTLFNVALSLLDLFQAVRTYSLRFGINNGPVYWIKMVDGSSQLIGHAINWTVRVMTAAKGGTVLVSDVYHNEILKPTIDYFRGHKFTKIEGLVTKKGEDIAAYQVEETQL
jgi:class 3 adenylate cyclase